MLAGRNHNRNRDGQVGDMDHLSHLRDKFSSQLRHAPSLLAESEVSIFISARILNIICKWQIFGRIPNPEAKRHKCIYQNGHVQVSVQNERIATGREVAKRVLTKRDRVFGAGITEKIKKLFDKCFEELSQLDLHREEKKIQKIAEKMSLTAFSPTAKRFDFFSPLRR